VVCLQALIVGAETGKILFMGVRSKYCTICHIVRRKLRELDLLDGEEENPAAEAIRNEYKDHKCTQNWGASQSSGSMESDIISEGFESSIKMHGLVYSKYCGDGDSSTKKTLVVARHYNGLVIEKIECKNHLWRAFNGHMKILATTSNKAHPIALRRVIGGRILRLRRKVNKCVKLRNEQNSKKEEKSVALKSDIICSAHCIFGDHSKCDKNNLDLCSEQDRKYPNNHVADLKKNTLWDKILDHMRRLINHSGSLIENMDSNIVECANAVLAKYCLNKSQLIPRTYKTRICAAVISFNSKGRLLHKMNRQIFNRTPGTHTKRMELRKFKKNRPENRISRKRLFQKPSAGGDKHYGPNVETPPLEGKELVSACVDFEALMDMSPEEIIAFEKDTKKQAECVLWEQKRKFMLTASFHGEVCKRRRTTFCKNLVERIAYCASLANIKSMDFGRKCESKAKKLLAKAMNIVIFEAGLFVCQEYPFLGASPDGLVGEDQIVEIKCSYSARDLSPEEGILAGKITCWRKEKDSSDSQPKFIFNKSHKYYYQIQSQLHYSNRKECIFAVYTEKEPFIKIEIIQRDEEFYKNEMESKLVQFYRECLLPELADPMHKRKLKIREPKFILDAIAEKEKASAKGAGTARRTPKNKAGNDCSIDAAVAVHAPRKKKRANDLDVSIVN